MWETERRMPVPCDRLLLTNPTKPSQRRQAPHTLASEVRERECSELNAERRDVENPRGRFCWDNCPSRNMMVSALYIRVVLELRNPR